MHLVTKAITWIAGALAAVVGGLIALAIVVAAFTGSMQTGVKASLTIAHYGVVATGGILSYSDNIAPDLEEGKAYGDKALADTKKESKN